MEADTGGQGREAQRWWYYFGIRLLCVFRHRAQCLHGLSYVPFTLSSSYIIIISTLRWGKWNVERWGNFSKITQLSDRFRTETQMYLIPKLGLLRSVTKLHSRIFCRDLRHFHIGFRWPVWQNQDRNWRASRARGILCGSSVVSKIN